MSGLAFFLLTKQIAVLGRLDRGVVGSWAEFSEFCEALSARGLEHNPAVEHRFRTAKGIIIDVVPFGGLADANGFIS